MMTKQKDENGDRIREVMDTTGKQNNQKPYILNNNSTRSRKTEQKTSPPENHESHGENNDLFQGNTNTNNHPEQTKLNLKDKLTNTNQQCYDCSQDLNIISRAVKNSIFVNEDRRIVS